MKGSFCFEKVLYFILEALDAINTVHKKWTRQSETDKEKTKQTSHCNRRPFLVGAFLGKSARLLQWLVFFSSDHRPHRVCTIFYRLHSRSHVLVSARFTVNPAVTGSSPCFSQKLFRAIFSALCDSLNFFRHCATPSNFFRHCATFFDFFVAKGSPFMFFDILQQTEVSKRPKGPPFLVFRHYETVSKISFFVFFFDNFSKYFYIF